MELNVAIKGIHLVFAIVLGAEKERISSLLVDEGACEITYPVIVIKTMLEAEWREQYIVRSFSAEKLGSINWGTYFWLLLLHCIN